jgi:hypothetical protein
MSNTVEDLEAIPVEFPGSQTKPSQEPFQAFPQLETIVIESIVAITRQSEIYRARSRLSTLPLVVKVASPHQKL